MSNVKSLKPKKSRFCLNFGQFQVFLNHFPHFLLQNWDRNWFQHWFYSPKSQKSRVLIHSYCRSFLETLADTTQPSGEDTIKGNALIGPFKILNHNNCSRFACTWKWILRWQYDWKDFHGWSYHFLTLLQPKKKDM